MKKQFYRIYIKNPNGPDFCAGGPLDKLIPTIMENDKERNDGIMVHQAVFIYMSKVNKPMSDDVFYEDTANTGLTFKLFQCGEIEEQED